MQIKHTAGMTFDLTDMYNLTIQASMKASLDYSIQFIYNTKHAIHKSKLKYISQNHCSAAKELTLYTKCTFHKNTYKTAIQYIVKKIYVHL